MTSLVHTNNNSTLVWHLLPNGSIKEEIVSAESFGLKPHPLSAVKSADTTEGAAEMLTGIISGTATEAQMNFVLMNAAVALVIDGKVEDLRKGYEMARAAVDDGRAVAVLNHMKGG